MYQVGEEEVDAVARVIRRSGELFRYGVGHECETFEQRYSAYLGVKHFALAASGSHALAAAITAVGLGPGDEVLIPAHTYMATATSVLTAGAIPVIVDVDESITLSPAAFEAAIGPRTRAVVPVHMWGTACDMDAIMEIAARRDVLVIEDACQGVGGGYKGRRFGSIGHIGAFSFNYFKNMTCGEGGGVAVNDDTWAERARCAIDPCHFYWQGRSDGVQPFSGNGARASELMGAMLNVQLDRIEGMVEAMRAERRTILEATRRKSLRQPRPARRADAQSRPRLRDARDLLPALGRRGAALRRVVPLCDRRQDRPAQLHRMGPGADGRRRGASGDEPLQHAGQRALPPDLFEGHVRRVARDPRPHHPRADRPRPHGGRDRRHGPQSRRRGAGGAGLRAARTGRVPQGRAPRRPEVRPAAGRG